MTINMLDLVCGLRSADLISSRTLPNASPFKRWGQTSFRSRATDTANDIKPLSTCSSSQRRPSSLLASSDNDVYTKSFSQMISSVSSDDRLLLVCNSGINNNATTIDDSIQGVEAWRTSFEKLLEDTTGLHTFAEFLKKEFSAENIYFWTACERYRQMDSADREKEAILIYSKHLGLGAAEPVNVDSQARNIAQDNLRSAAKDLFVQAQKQIFNLMKFDSYQRFIRSDLFKLCLDAETKNQPLPYRGDELDHLLKTWIGSTATITSTSSSTSSSTKLKKSLSNAEDRRRKSLLPWHRKVRCKSKDRTDVVTIEQNTQSTATNNPTTSLSIKSALLLANTTSDIHSSRSSLSSFDAALSCRTINLSDKDDPSKGSLCRVILTDGATTIVQTRSEETIRDLVERLLEKRAICYQAYDVFLSGGNAKPIELNGPSIELAGKEVLIEQRVVFKLDLPNRKVISVKSKPNKALAEVLRPILHKYNYSLDLVQIYKRNSNEVINMALPIAIADGQRLQVISNAKESRGEDQVIVVNQQIPSKTQKPSIKINSTIQSTSGPSFKQNFRPNMQQVKLDEITNKVFNQLLQGKVESHSHVTCITATNATIASTGTSSVQRDSDQGSIQSGGWSSETSSTGILGRLKRRNSNAPINRYNTNYNAKFRQPSKSSTGGSEEGGVGGGTSIDSIKKPLIAKLKAGVKLQVTGRSDNHDFLEGLKRAQCSRLEDQRGTEINFELPEFLKDKENYTLQTNAQRLLTNKMCGSEPIPLARNQLDQYHHNVVTTLLSGRPQPAPRHSIIKPITSTSILTVETIVDAANENVTTPTLCSKIFMENQNQSKDIDNKFSKNHNQNNDNTVIVNVEDNNSLTAPPPLPPKPKLLPPVKPSNWKQNSSSVEALVKGPNRQPQHQIDLYKSIELLSGCDDEDDDDVDDESAKSAYLDQLNSSFV